jgi:hypothetical protein
LTPPKQTQPRGREADRRQDTVPINTVRPLTPDFKWMGAPDTYRFFHKC